MLRDVLHNWVLFFQDDVLMDMLTVRENIAFSASLRLPKGTSSQQKRIYVDRIIEDLSLTHCQNARVI